MLTRPGYRWLLLCVLATAPSLARADVLTEAIPADAKAVLFVNDGTKLEANLDAFAKAINVPLEDSLKISSLAAAMGLGESWQIEQGAAVIVIAPSAKGIVLALPVKDSKAALAALNAQPQGDFHSVTLAGSPLVALAKDKVLFLAGDAEALGGLKSPAKAFEGRLTAEQKSLRSGADIFVYVDIAAWRPMINAGLDQFEQVIGQLGNIPGAFANPNMNPEATAEMLGLYVKGFRWVLDQTVDVCWTLSVNGQSVRMEKRARFSDGGHIHKLLASSQEPMANTLEGLPAMPFYFAIGADTKQLRPLLRDMLKTMMDLPSVAGKIDPKDREQIVSKGLAMYDQMNGFNTLVDLGPKGMTSVGRYFIDDPKLGMKQIAESMKSSEAMMRMFMPMELKAETTEKKVGDIDVTEMVFDFENMPEQQRRMIDAIYGGKLKMQFGVVNDLLSFAMGPQPDPIKMLQEKSKPLSDEPRVKAILADLPNRPCMVALVDPFGLVGMVKTMAAQFGGNAPNLKIPETLPPPVGIAVTGSKDSISGHLVVRSEMVRDLVTMVKSVRPNAGANP